jgi:DHA1 family tetracycline resistance protein-like MFS transporter
MTQYVLPSEQGELQGALASLRGVAMLFGPGLFSLTFAFFIAPEHHLPGAPWYLASILMLVSLGLAWVVAKEKKSDAVNGLAAAEAS